MPMRKINDENRKKMNKRCSNCNQDFEDNYSGIDQPFLRLSNETARTKSMDTFDVSIDPILEKPEYFCGFDCLKQWFNKKIETHDYVNVRWEKE